MLIAIDFDDTWSADPELWLAFVASLQRRGHRAIIATARRDIIENKQELRKWVPLDIPIVFCNHNYKREECIKHGYKPDVWIDDVPEGISHCMNCGGMSGAPYRNPSNGEFVQ